MKIITLDRDKLQCSFFLYNWEIKVFYLQINVYTGSLRVNVVSDSFSRNLARQPNKECISDQGFQLTADKMSVQSK